MANPRVPKVQELIKEELGSILFREIEMPEGALVTITRVEASGNLQQAKVYISVVPDEQGRQALDRLQKSIFPVQQALNERFKMRPVPKIRWVLETATAQAQHIEALLDNIKKEK